MDSQCQQPQSRRRPFLPAWCRGRAHGDLAVPGIPGRAGGRASGMGGLGSPRPRRASPWTPEPGLGHRELGGAPARRGGPRVLGTGVGPGRRECAARVRPGAGACARVRAACARRGLRALGEPGAAPLPAAAPAPGVAGRGPRGEDALSQACCAVASCPAARRGGCPGQIAPLGGLISPPFSPAQPPGPGDPAAGSEAAASPQPLTAWSGDARGDGRGVLAGSESDRCRWASPPPAPHLTRVDSGAGGKRGERGFQAGGSQTSSGRPHCEAAKLQWWNLQTSCQKGDGNAKGMMAPTWPLAMVPRP